MWRCTQRLDESVLFWSMTRLLNARAVALLVVWGFAVASLGAVYPTAKLSISEVALAFTLGGGLGVINARLLDLIQVRQRTPHRSLGREATLAAVVVAVTGAFAVVVISVDWVSALSLGPEAAPAIFLAAAASVLVGGLLRLGSK